MAINQNLSSFVLGMMVLEKGMCGISGHRAGRKASYLLMLEPPETMVQSSGDLHGPFLNVCALALCADLEIKPEVR